MFASRLLLGCLTIAAIATTANPSWGQAPPRPVQKVEPLDPFAPPAGGAQPFDSPDPFAPADLNANEEASSSLSQVAPRRKPAAMKHEVVLSGLDTPASIVVQPGVSDFFVAESGAGQVTRLRWKDGKLTAAPSIIGFAVSTPDEHGMKGGPLALAFLEKYKLLVGHGGQAAGDSPAQVYEIPDDGKPQGADAAIATLGPMKLNDKAAQPGRFVSAVVIGSALYLAPTTGESVGLVVAEVEGAKFGTPRSFPRGASASSVAGAAGLTVTPRYELLVSFPGGRGAEADSELGFYWERNDRQLMRLKLDLFDVVAAAYSPDTGRLYVLDHSTSDPSKGGLYRLDLTHVGNKPGVKSVKMLELTRPTSMAFAPDHGLYITILGEKKPGEKSGQVIKVTGL